MPAPSLVDALAHLAHDKDKDSWAVVLELAGPACWRCCQAIMEDFCETEDAFHETLMQIRDDAGQFRPRTNQPEEDARRWVCRVATTTALMMRRSRVRAIARDKEAGKMQDSQFTPDLAADLANREEVHAFCNALCTLKEPRRTVIAMHHLQGISVPDIAIELRRPQGTIKTWISRGLAELKAGMATQGHVMSVSGLIALGSLVHAASVRSALPASAIHHAASILTNGCQPTVHALSVTSSGATFMKIKIAGIFLMAGVTLCAMTDLLSQDVPLPEKLDELPQVMPAGVEQVIDAIVEKAIAAGLPDAKGGKLFRGAIVVIENATTPGTVPGDAGGKTHTQVFNGVHLKLADGNWVINLAYPLPSGPGWSVDAKNLSELPVDKLVTTAQEFVGRGWKKENQWYANSEVDKFEPDQQDMIRALYNDFTPVQCLLQATPTMAMAWMQPEADDDLAIQTAFLVRLGLPHAEQMAVLCDGHVLCEDERVSPIRDAEAAPLTLFKLGSGLPMYAVCFAQVKSENRALPHPYGHLPDLGTSFRRLLAVHFYDQLVGDEVYSPYSQAMVDPEVAARAVLALADEAALPKLRDELPGLVARMKLAGQANAGADLVTRLALWDSGNVHPDNDSATVPDTDNLLDDYLPYHKTQAIRTLSDAQVALLPEIFRTSAQQVRDAPTFTQADLGGLIALVSDGRPSRWLDHEHFRTVGDHALRMIAFVLAIDPRILVGRDIAAPWNAAERAATASVLTSWWKENHGKSLEQLATPGVDKAPLTQLACLLQRPVSDAKERERQLDLIAATWVRNPPRLDVDYLNTTDLAYVLAAGQSNTSIRNVVDAWPLEGPGATLLAAWHLQRGDSAAFMAFLSKTANPPEEQKQQRINQDMATLMTTANLKPDQHFIDYLVDLFNGPLDAPKLKVVWSCIEWSGYSVNSPEFILMHLNDMPRLLKVADGSARAYAVLPLVLDGILLNDQRLAPDWMKKFQSEAHGAQVTAHDVRVCDLTASSLPGCYTASRWFLPEIAKDLQQIGQVNLNDNLLKRDQTILKQRGLIAKYLPAALKEAHLKTTIPGITLVSEPGSDL